MGVAATTPGNPTKYGEVGWQYLGGGVYGPGMFVTADPAPEVGDGTVVFPWSVFRGFNAYRLRGAQYPPQANPAIPSMDSVIENASLILFHGTIVGNPYDAFAGGGPFVVTHVDYLDDGFLGSGDFFQTSIAGPIIVSTTAVIGSRTVDVTGFVFNANLREPRDPLSAPTFAAQTVYVGFRLEWAATDVIGVNTDGFPDTDWVEFMWHALRVTYR